MRRQLQWRWTAEEKGEKVYFAFCFPMSYEEQQSRLARVDRLMSSAAARDANIFYARQLALRSLEGRRMDVLTITSRDGMLEEREEALESLFEEEEGGRPPMFADKPTVFISARVHPGETPASFVFDGLLSFLCSPTDPRAAVLRRRFVFKLVPMLNPDGVARGHYRADTLGQNLNRCYQSPQLSRQPTVFAARSILLSAARRGALAFYLDLHAHASKRGCFLYGNKLPAVEQQAAVHMYAHLVALNTPYLEYSACNFSEKNMKHKDRRDKGLSKEGSGRVAIYRATDILYSYTLECNYNTGRCCNDVPAADAGGDGRATPERPSRGIVPKYTTAMWADVGKACVIALLDMHNCNPWPRIGNSEWRTLEGMRQAVVRHLLTAGKRKSVAAAAGGSGGGGGGGSSSSSAAASRKGRRVASAGRRRQRRRSSHLRRSRPTASAAELPTAVKPSPPRRRRAAATVRHGGGSSGGGGGGAAAAAAAAAGGKRSTRGRPRPAKAGTHSRIPTPPLSFVPSSRRRKRKQPIPSRLRKPTAVSRLRRMSKEKVEAVGTALRSPRRL
eukprot:PLAT863.1.p1 GENE.PLAT863.1~~PLAT863.1.p1  ORF type:complete len:559 (+),score=186.85 PLAT863.1:42-1718(+)